MQLKPYRSGGVLALTCLIVAFPAASAGAAAESPFGEPELVLDLQDREVQGPFAVGEIAVLLVTRPDSTRALWRTNGPQQGTFSIHPEVGVSFLQILPSTSGYQWLLGRDALTGAEALWRTDGTAEGTRRLADDLRVTEFGYHRGLDLLFFTAVAPAAPGSGDLDHEPWVSDGTAAGTRPLGDLLPTGASRPFAYREHGDDMAFLAADPAGTANGLWLSDGTPEGTRLVGVPDDGSFRQLEVSGSELHLRPPGPGEGRPSPAVGE